MDTSSLREAIVASFPRLGGQRFTIIGPASRAYNCVAYVAGDSTQWWGSSQQAYWPPGLEPSRRTESLIEMFESLGYERCGSAELEGGFRKIALYEDSGNWKHVAVQTTEGRWRSKLGEGPGIEHESPESLSGENYGNPTVFMRRPLQPYADEAEE